jgi:hypothetical protein
MPAFWVEGNFQAKFLDWLLLSIEPMDPIGAAETTLAKQLGNSVSGFGDGRIYDSPSLRCSHGIAPD